MKLTKRFDSNEGKHLIEGIHFVLHCHHYNTLIHRAIVSTPFLDGKEFIFQTVAQDFAQSLPRIVQSQKLSGKDAILSACSEFYSLLGFGKMDLSALSATGGRAVSTSSHLASGYLAKWGKQDQPVDDFGRGFVAAAWATAFGKDVKVCKVVQTRCIAKGDSTGEFTVEV
ncbi:MAG TPA: hypothetical protein P5560_09940 [Thermotogota bacterium]|nr:hypothetical protein [Thermotogota bacterium]HRW93255.1 hypothetical protein [Thermotogota bacterium]